MATGSLYGSSAESTGLYGIGAASGGTYFEWFIFQDSATAPANPTGGSWSFSTNTGVAPTGWVNSPPPAPVNQVWVSIAVVDSRNATTLVWSTPGLMTGSGLPILTGSGVPSSGTGLNGQLYINTATTPQSLYNKQAGAWVQLTGSNLVDLVNNQTIGGVKTFSQTIQGSISGTASNVSGIVAVANGGTGATTASDARTNLGLGTLATQNASAVAITGGSITGITDLAVADGGTGASTASQARINLDAVGLSDTQTLTNKSISGSTNTLSNIPNSALTNSSLNINGVNFTLGAVQTIGADWLLPSYAGNAGKVLAVNPSASDVQWIPAAGVGTVTSIDVSGGTTGLTTFGGPITAAGTITLGGTLAVTNGGTGATTASGARTSLGAVGLSDVETLTNKTLTSPKINEILDTNGNEILGFSPTASATDFLTVKNGIGVGVPLHIQADGSSANIGLHIQPKGTGLVTISDGTDFNKGIRFRSSGSAAGVTTLIDAVSSAGHVVTLPDATTTLVGRNTTDTLTNKTFGDNPTFSAGTANGVAYLNGSKVLTTGSALTFDGTNLGIGTSSPGYALDAQRNVESGVIANFQSTSATATYTGIAFRSAASNASARNWSLTMNNNAFGDFAIRTSTANGGDPIAAGVNRLVINASGQLETGIAGTAAAPSFTRTGDTNTGIFFPAADTIAFAEGGVEAMRLDASGNLGLGVTPSAWNSDYKAIQLGANGGISGRVGASNSTDIVSNTFRDSGGAWRYIASSGVSRYTIDGSTSSHIWYTAPSGTAGNAISFSQSMTLDASGNLSLGTTSAIGRLAVVGNYAFFRENSAGADVYIRGYYGNANVAAIQVVSDSPLAFLTNNTERARIDSSGNLLVGTTSASLTGVGGYWEPSGRINLGKTGTSTYMGFYVSGTIVGSIATDGSITSYNTSSDYRLKNITGPITTSGAYIDSLNPVEGTWKTDGSTFVGLIAHEVQEASRTPVATGTKDGEEMQGMDYSSAELIANMLAELKSLRARVAQLEAA